MLSAVINAPVSKTIKELMEFAPEVAKAIVKMLKKQVGVKGEAKAYSNQAELVEELEKVESEEVLQSYGAVESKGKMSCPLGHVQVKVEGLDVMGLVDSGSMINIIPTEEALRGKIPWVERGLTPITGIGGHETLVHGVCASTPVEVAGVTRSLHFLVADVPQMVLGRPFLYEFGATLAYGSGGREVLRLLDNEGCGVMVAICGQDSGQWPGSPEELERMVGSKMPGGKGLGLVPGHFCK